MVIFDHMVESSHHGKGTAVGLEPTTFGLPGHSANRCATLSRRNAFYLHHDGVALIEELT